MNIQWYPGHMTKAKRNMQEDIRLVDLVIELLDARVPFSSRNPDIDRLAAGKARLVLLNKADLADPQRSQQWKAWFENQGCHTVLLDSRASKAMKEVRQVIEEACSQKRERDRRRGILNRPVRAMVVGIPNVGKSTFINTFAGRAAARTGDKPGVTRGNQWIRLGKGVELLDTPGILWPKFEDAQVGCRLAACGAISDTIADPAELALWLIDFLQREYLSLLRDRYGAAQLSGEEKPLAVLEEIARLRGCIGKGSELDLNRAARLLLEDFRSGRLGQITLETPEE